MHVIPVTEDTYFNFKYVSSCLGKNDAEALAMLLQGNWQEKLSDREMAVLVDPDSVKNLKYRQYYIDIDGNKNFFEYINNPD